MKLDKVSLADTRSFSPFFLDYISKKESLKPFYNRYPLLENFADQIAEKTRAFPREHREILVQELEKQYEGLEVSSQIKENISLLKDEKTFTITTGHQLNIFTGPLYFIFKIVTVINTCKKLKEKYPEYNFVPVYWMASEDHDYDEIKYFKLYGKKYTWETNQTGAVGRFNTKGLDVLANELPGDLKIFREAYKKGKTLSSAVRQYTSELFGHEGLIALDADSQAFKTLLRGVIQKDIFESVNKTAVDKTNDALEKLGYKTQVFCREVNFFYLDHGIRNRIEKHDDRFKVIDTEISFNSTELQKLIQEEPEKFSPNVILRPLYQEVILPNLAYVGGPAEVIYWLQLKKAFDNANVSFPILMPRNFGMVVDHEVARKFGKTSLEFKDLFDDKNHIFNHWVLKNTSKDLTVGAERAAVSKIFDQLKEKAFVTDKTLAPFVSAESKRILNSFEKIEQKLLRAEKRLHADKLRQIEHVKDALFPGTGLQERTDNFLNFYLQDSHFIKKLLDTFDPFDFQFNILSYTTS
jgi:bacillithiol synthase